MVLRIPTHEEYRKSTDTLTHFFNTTEQKIHWVIYGSFVNGKLRPGLSDIDIFVLAESENILFPMSINIAIGEVKDQIEALGIPLQISRVTTTAMQNVFSAPDSTYLQEVQKGIEGGYCSGDFSKLLLNMRDGREDDCAMGRYFLRKINELGDNFLKVSAILEKETHSITPKEQKDLRHLWDVFKKSLTLYCISLRRLNGLSIFSEQDTSIFSHIKLHFGIEAHFETYEQLLSDIKNIDDWYIFLKNGGLERIHMLYNQTFIPATNSIVKILHNLHQQEGLK